MSGPLSLGLMSANMVRAAAELATSAAKSLTRHANAAVGGMTDAQPATEFANLLDISESVENDSVPKLRERLSALLESILGQMGIPTDPAMTFVAQQDGSLRLETPHDRTAEIEGSINENGSVRSIATDLGQADQASRRIVLHRVRHQ